ncbi:Ubiquitin-related domain containing protein [Amanita muscaria]
MRRTPARTGLTHLLTCLLLPPLPTQNPLLPKRRSQPTSDLTLLPAFHLLPVAPQVPHVPQQDEQAHQTPFPARPATASAASSSSAGAFGFGFGIFGGGYGGYGRYGGSGRERLTDVVSTGGGDDEYDDDEDVQEQERGQDKPQGRAPSPSHSTASSHQQPPVADSITEAPVPASAQAPVPQDPQAYISFLLVTGCRRTMSFEPETTVGRVKELVWNTWPEDEEWRKDRPPAPSYLRLVYLGRLLQDEDTLTKLKIPLSHSTFPQPTIVHLSIRPCAPPTTGAENSESLNKKMGRLRRRSGDGSSLSSLFFFTPITHLYRCGRLELELLQMHHMLNKQDPLSPFRHYNTAPHRPE